MAIGLRILLGDFFAWLLIGIGAGLILMEFIAALARRSVPETGSGSLQARHRRAGPQATTPELAEACERCVAPPRARQDILRVGADRLRRPRRGLRRAEEPRRSAGLDRPGIVDGVRPARPVGGRRAASARPSTGVTQASRPAKRVAHSSRARLANIASSRSAISGHADRSCWCAKSGWSASPSTPRNAA